MQSQGLNSTAELLFLLLAPLKLVGADGPPPARPPVHHQLPPSTFQPDSSGGYTFDNGVLRGRLHHAGKALGLTEVVHLPSGGTLSCPYGLLSPYRVFSGIILATAPPPGIWPATTRLLDAGTVEVRWAAEPERPFELRMVYRWARTRPPSKPRSRSSPNGRCWCSNYSWPRISTARVRRSIHLRGRPSAD